ncbi:MAG: NYN domain-containing protein [Candidatus Anammoxibacter sp.]
MLIVIDGYNLIFTVSDLEKHVKVNDIEEAREILISVLIRYKAIKRYNIVLVFDSSHNYSDKPTREGTSGIEIVYAKYSKDADTEIKQMIMHCENPGNALVITNDNDIRKFVQKNRSKVLDCKSFYSEIAKTLGWNKKGLPSEYRSKYEGASNTENEYWLNIFEGNIKDKSTETEHKTDTPSKELRQGELLSKYTGPSQDETHYWLEYFRDAPEDNEGIKNE